jgi:hypothetical protein
MNDKPQQLGVVRICAKGTVFEIPYFAEHEFRQLVFATRANDALDHNGVFVPYRAIDWMVQVPVGTPERHDFSQEMTRQ